jgi:hypothetical protein
VKCMRACIWEVTTTIFMVVSTEGAFAVVCSHGPHLDLDGDGIPLGIRTPTTIRDQAW